MRKRKYLIGATFALALAVAMPTAAFGAASGQTMSVQVTGTKQDKKVRGPAGLNVTINTSYGSPQGSGPGGNTSTSNTVVDFDKDFLFTPGNLAKCNPVSLNNTTTEQAKALCGKSEVGSGASLLNQLGNGPQVNAVVTAFNGTPVGGNPQLILHTKTNTAAAASLLNGVLITSPLGSPYGKRLDVTVPDTGALGLYITSFQTSVPKLVTKTKKKKDKATGKTKKVKTYYISAKCSSDKKWSFQETSTFRQGGVGAPAPPITAQAADVPCKQKPKKKK